MEEGVHRMSLLSEAMEKFCYVNKARIADGEGGYIVTWTDGAEFIANARLDTSMQARRAQVEGVTSLYTITTRKYDTLEYHDVVKRLSDGQVFRVTSDGTDKKTPESATLDMRQVTAESWVIPS